MPYEACEVLREGREEKADDVERDEVYLRNSINAYLEMAGKFGYHVITCAEGTKIRTPKDIGTEILDIVLEEIQFQHG